MDSAQSKPEFVNCGEAEAESEGRTPPVFSKAAMLSPGDLVIHLAHGLGRFEGLQTIEAQGMHEAFVISYRDGRLMVPVEDLGLLSRFGPPHQAANLDRLDSGTWGTRKRRAVRKIEAIALRLVGIAAERELEHVPKLLAQPEEIERFSDSFPYELTPDQAATIAAVERDLRSGKPMDRLVCGDVGTGKTEIALRAAFIAARAGMQVAVFCPTTVLARQHTETFRSRFADFPVRIETASRFSGARSGQVKDAVASGSIDIAIGTHALLGKDVRFARLGLLIIDEEQRFGVQHKERLKQLREGVHVLTLTATPIPRTLQLALTPVRQLSIIATPPQGRRPIDTVVGSLDGPTIRKLLLAERTRHGQSFFVCPRIADIDPAARFLDQYAPGLRVVAAHGKMPPADLERIMLDFDQGRFDVLLSTTIIESGLDVPSANTMIVHDAHRLGLAELYQLRGRIGRSNVPAHAYFSVPAQQDIGDAARRRLEVLQSLDAVGAGFDLASRDMDIRGAGNLLGEEQSGHIKEIGFDLFQVLLNRAVAELRRRDKRDWRDAWVPRLALGVDARLPRSYLPEVEQRIDTYWRLAQCESEGAIDELAAEITELHGVLPSEAKTLIELAKLRLRCRAADVAEIVAGPRGMLLTPRAGLKLGPKEVERAALMGRVLLKRDGRLALKVEANNATQRLQLAARLIESASSPAQARMSS